MGLRAFEGCEKVLGESEQLVALNGQRLKCWVEAWCERGQGAKGVKRQCLLLVSGAAQGLDVVSAFRNLTL